RHGIIELTANRQSPLAGHCEVPSMFRCRSSAAWITAMLALPWGPTALAQLEMAGRPGLNQPPRPLVLKSLRAEITIQDAVATTHLDQLFVNSTAERLDGVYRIALPPDAAVTDVSVSVEEPGHSAAPAA